MKNRIQKLCRDKRITQEELAVLCTVTRQTIISLENGRYNPSIFLAHKISQIFHLTIEEAFLFEEDIHELR
ncbi:helix-turn-helix transcriptional regulator [Desulfosporosinus shakirovi]|uniref:helix-turn-helix transcriptional regulator n=1 Tax=Desulfosporosinus shakirovi TaxID=2885154 RepID=UPI001E431047|nr:helix-turn-helix transcriptional regulator [Desulfosporosinus sp. SRJS8]MCB8818110.1 helix-turn-helix transcriptional regulator [Desulfosporosinus sp. SRJS8]